MSSGRRTTGTRWVSWTPASACARLVRGPQRSSCGPGDVQRPADHPVQVVRDAGPHLARAAERRAVVRGGGQAGAVTAGPPSGQGRVGDRRRAPRVVPGGVGLVGRLQAADGGVDGQAGDLQLPVRRPQHVLRLQAQVRQPRPVRGHQRLGHVDAQLPASAGRSGPSASSSTRLVALTHSLTT